MSSDLLVAFDSFYQPPKPATSTTNKPETKPSQPSAINDFPFFETPEEKVDATAKNGSPSKQDMSAAELDDIWAVGNSSNAPESRPAVAAFDPWASLEMLEEPSKSTARREAVNSTSSIVGASARLSHPGITRASTLELFSTSIADLAESKQTEAASYIKPPKKSKDHSNNEVLFDAADELGELGDDDEFGDFETVEETASQRILKSVPSTVQKAPTKPQDLALGTDNLRADPFPYPQAPKSPSFQERNPFAELSLATTPITASKQYENTTDSPVTAWPVYEPPKPRTTPYHDSPLGDDIMDQEEWGDFADLPPETPAQLDVEKKPSGIEVDAWAWDTVDAPASMPVKDTEISQAPPTNVPPPAVLLGLFQQLLDLTQSTLFKSVANQPFALKNRILSDPSTIDFLHAYILLAVVAARLIAGRKLRWKRDSRLSQSMKIGPAAAGGRGGMKLMGIDKTETTREEREVAEVIRIWKEQVGRLRSAITTANSSIQNNSLHLVIPEINEVMPIKIATMAEGAMTSPKACVLCGLKREERIIKVDTQVEDSFGEWWVDHWGHRTCKNFWQEHEGKLKQR